MLYESDKKQTMENVAALVRDIPRTWSLQEIGWNRPDQRFITSVDTVPVHKIL
jgi:hypothetical protein